MPEITKIKKRDGSITDFNAEKITAAIEKTITDTKQKDNGIAKKITKQVVEILEKSFPKDVIPSTQDVEDILLSILNKSRQTKPLADAFQSYKKRYKETLGFRTIHGVRDDIGLSENAINILAKRYLLRNEEGAITETPARMFRRVAKAIAKPETLYKKSTSTAEEEFYKIMANLEFLPNSPTLMNAGTTIGQLSACFVLPIEDSLKSIFHALEQMALIHQSGGGTGFSFSRIRPKGDLVRSTKGIASGPISFMTIFDKATEIIKQGGKRRGANMGILEASHPDIVDFINAKKTEGMLRNFNISVAATDEFMESAIKNKEFWLINPRTKQKVKRVSAKVIFEIIVKAAWETGDPGMIFIDEINRKNPTPKAGTIESTNPCGEVPLLPYESCNLGSINLSKMVVAGRLDWNKLKKTIRTAVHFLDNVIDANIYPMPEIEAMTKANRKIGLGVMGFADCLAKMKLPYDSDKAITFAEKLMKFIQDEARKKSEELGRERGNFPNFEQSTLKEKYKNMRNATVTTIAPTGTLSIIANVTSGIEPFFAITYVREVLEKTKMLIVDPVFEEIAKKEGFYSKQLMLKIAQEGSVQKIKEVPKDIKRAFVTSFDIKPEWHVKIQAAFQKYVDNAVSKTVNMPKNATEKDIENIFTLAYKLKCKGITVYRYGSKKEQVLYIGKDSDTSCQKETCPY
ncbi:MAG: adenosylcobalamin-dependent ribonucleoside-diphosphate reductase [Candidatus Woesearchaeota archaeon]